jgi:uncharacterized phage protein (predicted DNA packaging)
MLDLEAVKQHLNIDRDFNIDDEYLNHLIKVAEEVIEKHIDNKLQYIAENNGGELPSPLLQAMLLFIGNMYANRESTVLTSVTELPYSYNYLLQLYQAY